MNGHDNNICFDSDYKSLVFVGKATRITGSGLTYYPKDAASWSYTQNLYQGGSSFSYVGGTGVRSVTCTGCAGNGLPFSRGATATLPDDNGYYTYSIACLTKPVIFEYSSSPDNITINILSVVNSGTSSGGLTVWYIKVALSYPSGFRESALGHANLYCFSTIPNNPTSSYGMAMYTASGELSFNSTIYKPLRLMDLVTINSVSFPTGYLTNQNSLLMNLSTSPSPVTSVYSVAKPSFMNVDWGRLFTQTYLYNGNLNLGHSEYDGCKDDAAISMRFNQAFICGGLYLNSARTQIFSTFMGLDIVGYGCDAGVLANYSQLITNTKIKTPTYIPVINGADYD